MIDDLRNSFENKFEAELMAQCSQIEPRLMEMVRYHFGWHDEQAQRGKRLRPLILLLATSALGCPIDRGLNPAIALETFHNFTLVHDDIQDKGELRQGRLAMWKRYGMEQAINTGDFMAYLAFKILNQPNPEISAELHLNLSHSFVSAGMDVMRGQHLDMLFEKETHIELEEYLTMIKYKTARLFSLAFEIAGLLNGVSKEKINILRAIGTEIGIAFQIQDDYLGIWGDSHLTGKSTSTDIKTRKKTYPLILGQYTIPEIQECFTDTTPLDDLSVQKMTSALSDAKVDQKTINLALSYKKNALSHFETIFTKESEAKKGLRDILDKMIK